MPKGMIAFLKSRGFDESYHIKFTREYKVKCSQCSVLVINGIPTHENGCPNRKREEEE